MPESTEPREDLVELTDPRAIRAIAHPARMVVIDALYDRGIALTATQAAELAGTTPSAMSYHLRSLARFGIIKRADAGDGRERPWVRAGRDLAIRPSSPTYSTAAAAATESVLSTALAFDRDRLLAALRRLSKEGAALPLDEIVSYGHTALLVTLEEAKAVLNQMNELLAPYRRESRADAPPQAGVLMMTITTTPDPDSPGAATPDHERT